ncbi:hypothetical protein ACH5RR_025684 [Cinchona calisaya]|uniref:Uncharacterized protein n=1 Tax=Cinchona calisaya TaxID=153742 RepID=A0ABD2Z0C4_9GENT
MIYALSWEMYENFALEDVSRPLVEELALPKERQERIGKSLSSTCIIDSNAMFKYIAQIGNLYHHLHQAEEYHLTKISNLELKLKEEIAAKEKHFKALCVVS